MTASTCVLGPASWDDPEVQALVAAQQAELRARGRGISRTVLTAPEGAALKGGWTTLRLETGPRRPEASGFYESAGYRPIAPFAAYVDEPDAGCSLYCQRVLGPA